MGNGYWMPAIVDLAWHPPSAIPREMWPKIVTRLKDGESGRGLAREFRVAESTIWEDAFVLETYARRCEPWH